MKCVLVTVWSGIIERVTFFDDASQAIIALAEHVKSMDVEKQDAAVFGPDGMTANAKDLLDESDQYCDNLPTVLAIAEKAEEQIYLIGNPQHQLGFMVASPDNPLGYKNPAAALFDLGQMRNEYGSHLRLYRVEPVNGPVAQNDDLKKLQNECEVEDFDYALVNEYLKELS
jgi:hypothetical protein